MLSEGTHDQNTSRLQVKLDHTGDQAAVAEIEAKVRDLLQKLGMEGEFYPAERVDTHG
jgi:translation elongation factor EF-Tu-like GTPase